MKTYTPRMGGQDERPRMMMRMKNTEARHLSETKELVHGGHQREHIITPGLGISIFLRKSKVSRPWMQVQNGASTQPNHINASIEVVWNIPTGNHGSVVVSMQI